MKIFGRRVACAKATPKYSKVLGRLSITSKVAQAAFSRSTRRKKMSSTQTNFYTSYQDNLAFALVPHMGQKAAFAAIFLDHLDYWLTKTKKAGFVTKDGHKWVYNTYQEWCKKFNFLTHKVLGAIVRKLEELDLIITKRYDELNHIGFIEDPSHFKEYDRTKWYRLNQAAIDKLIKDFKPASRANVPNETYQRSRQDVATSQTRRSSYKQINTNLITNKQADVVVREKDRHEEGVWVQSRGLEPATSSTSAAFVSCHLTDSANSLNLRGDNFSAPPAEFVKNCEESCAEEVAPLPIDSSDLASVTELVVADGVRDDVDGSVNALEGGDRLQDDVTNGSSFEEGLESQISGDGVEVLSGNAQAKFHLQQLRSLEVSVTPPLRKLVMETQAAIVEGAIAAYQDYIMKHYVKNAAAFLVTAIKNRFNVPSATASYNEGVFRLWYDRMRDMGNVGGWVKGDDGQFLVRDTCYNSQPVPWSDWVERGWTMEKVEKCWRNNRRMD
jgi:hypothetical protein